MDEPVTDADAAVLRHMLGIVDTSQRDPRPTRDYYAAEPGDEQMARLVALGLVERCGDAWGHEYHRTTDAGKVAALDDFKRCREPKSKRIYARYLDIADVVPGLTDVPRVHHERHVRRDSEGGMSGEPVTEEMLAGMGEPTLRAAIELYGRHVARDHALGVDTEHEKEAAMTSALAIFKAAGAAGYARCERDVVAFLATRCARYQEHAHASLGLTARTYEDKACALLDAKLEVKQGAHRGAAREGT